MPDYDCSAVDRGNWIQPGLSWSSLHQRYRRGSMHHCDNLAPKPAQWGLGKRMMNRLQVVGEVKEAVKEMEEKCQKSHSQRERVARASGPGEGYRIY